MTCAGRANGFISESMTNAFVDTDTHLPDWAGALKRRLSECARVDQDRETGDHILNPEQGPYARSDGPPRDAAVLIGIRDTRDGPSVVLTERTRHLKSHAGQVAFPGGKIDPEDAGPVAAAFREANEEIGLPLSNAIHLGNLAPYLTGSGYRVVPVVARLEDPISFHPNPDEVDRVFEVPFSFLMDPANHLKRSLDWKGTRRYFYAMPFAGHNIWGVTAGIIRSLYETVYCE